MSELDPDQIPSRFAMACASKCYRLAANLLMETARQKIPESYYAEEWDARLWELTKFCRIDDREAIWRWFRREYPAAMQLVPKSYRDKFTKGVQESCKQQFQNTGG